MLIVLYRAFCASRRTRVESYTLESEEPTEYCYVDQQNSLCAESRYYVSETGEEPANEYINIVLQGRDALGALSHGRPH